MAITDLIAQGGTNIPSPVDRYIQGRNFAGQQQARQQESEIRRQQIGLQQQKAQIQQQQEMRARGEEYAKTIAPTLKQISDLPEDQRTLKQISDLPEDQRQPAYQQVLPQFKQEAQKFGLPLDNLSPTWDDQKAKMVVDRFYEPPKAPETRTVKKGDEFVTEEWTGSEWKEVGRGPRRTEVVQGTPEQFKPTKTTTNKVQEQILNISELQDNLYDLDKVISSSPNIQTVWADLGTGILQLGGRLGIKYDGSAADLVKDKNKVIGYTRKVQDAYRRSITGSQANKYELQRIEGQMPNEKDDFNTIKDKIKLWQNTAERLNVRYKRLLNNGFEYAGKGQDGSALYKAPDGVIRDIGEIASLDNIKPHEEMRDELANQIMKENPQLPEADVAKAVINEMARMGYNVRRYGN